MAASQGAPPRSGWARLKPELLVTDLSVSLSFWCDLHGVAIAYQRPETHFAYLERPDGNQLMLCQRSGEWETGPLERPFGRGVVLQVYVDTLEPVIRALSRRNRPFYAAPREVWRRWGDREGGSREFLVQDPDGYLVMVAEHIGERPLAAGPTA